MTRVAATRTWTLATLAAIVVAVLAAFARHSDILGEFGFLWVTIGLALAMSVAAIPIAKRCPGFSLTVAAETIIAFGIFALVVGLLVAIYTIVEFGIGEGDVTFASLRPVVLPFLEGLGTAATAPVLATTLRNYETVVLSDEPVASGPADVTEVTADLLAQIHDVSTELARMNTAIAQQTGQLSTGLVNLNAAIGKQTAAYEATTASVSRAASGLANALQSETRDVKGRLEELRGEMKALTAAASESRQALAGVTDEAGNLRAASREATILLDALSKLIESVERFVQPDSTAA